MRHIAVVGGGVSGVSAAATLRDGGYAGDLTLVEHARLPYDRPPLSKDYLTGERDLAQIALQPAEWYDDQRIQLISSTTVTAVVPSADTVHVMLHDGGTLSAERVVLATGGSAAVPPIPGLSAIDVAGLMHVLRDVEHADRLRAVLVAGSRLLIIGAGLIGAEIASTAVGLGCSVVMVDPVSPPLSVVGREVAAWLHGEHSRHGIDVRATTVLSVANTNGGVTARLGDDSVVQVDAVVVGTGMTPNTELAVAAGLEIERGVLVDEQQVTSHPRVLAIGDTAQRRGQPPAEHWEAALHDGKRAAATLMGHPPPRLTAPWWWSDRHGAHVEGVGHMHEPDHDHDVVVRGTVGHPPFSAFTIRGPRVVGAVAVDDPNAVRAARRLIDGGIEVDARCLADSDTDLRKLVRR